MKNKDNRPTDAAPSADSTGSPQADEHRLSSVQAGQDLRKQAEAIAREQAAQSPENLESRSPEETRRTFHELRVHQIELEMQNEELRRAQVELDAVRARYFDLYDLAPVGYCTLSEKGLILEANLNAATLMGAARGALIKQRLTSFILPEDHHIYHRHHKLLFETGEPQTCEFRMLRRDVAPFWVRMLATVAQDEEGAPVCRVVMSDINARKQAEETLQQAHNGLEHRVAGQTEELRQANEALQTDIIERRRVEEALRESDATLRHMTEQLVDVLFATDNNGFITFASPSALQVFGWKPDEMVGRNFIEFLPDAEIPGAVKKFKEVMASGQSTQNLSYILKRKDESNFPGELNSSVIWKDGRIAGAIGLLRDITERRRAEEGLKESEERYRNQVESINDVAYAVGSVGEITYISPVVRHMLGYEPDEITGRSFLEFVHQDDHDLLTRKFSELREGVVSHDEYRVIGKSGDVKWVMSQTRPILDIEGFVGGRGILVDVTERKRMEETLRRTEENFRRFLDESPLGVRIVTSEGETIYANRAILGIYGYDSIEELKTTAIQNRYTRESYDEFRIRREKRRQGVEVPSEYTIDIIRNNGDVRHLRVFRKDILWDDERQYQVIYQDITERKSLEMQLIQAQKMDALGTLASGIAHDFNNILAAVIGFTEMAMDESNKVQRSHHLDKVLVSCDRAKNLISQIISFSRRSGVEKKPLYIGTLVRESVELLRSTTPTTIEIRQCIASEALVALANPTQMQQVMMNLCANAIHAMTGKGGVLEITLAAMDIASDSPLLFLDLKPGSYLKLEVRDTGHGIDPADISRIFDPFFTTKGVSGGSGLGLSVVYGIVKNHSGAVAVDSVPGVGSTFKVYIPALQNHEEAGEPEVGEMPHGHERILFVDDEKSIVEVGRGMLKMLGYVVIDFTDSVQACEAFKRSPYAYDLVITDMTMPRMTGVELSREVLKVRPEMPIILCTGHSDLMDEDKAKQEGIRRFVMKPLRRRELAHAVRSVLDEEKTPQRF